MLKSFERNSKLLAAGLLLLGIGCSGRNLYPDKDANPRVLVREWTRATHGEWEAGERGAEHSNAVFYDNTLVFGSLGKGVTSIYPGMNAVRWNYPVSGGVSSELYSTKDAIYFVGADGFLVSLNAENGRVNWRYEIRGVSASRPTVSQGRLLVTTSDDKVIAFDAGSGEWLWHYRRSGSSSATIQGASTPLISGNEVYVGLSDGYLANLNLQDGSLKWQKRLAQNRKFTDVDASPVLDQSTIYVPSYDGALYALRKNDGETLWRFESGGSQPPVLDEQKLYFPSSDGFIYCLNKQSGAVNWKFELDGGVPTKVAVTDHLVLFGSSHQYFYALSKEDGKLLYRYDVGHGSGFYGSPLFDRERQRIYALSGGGNLMAFSIRQPRRKNFARGDTDPYDY